MSPGPAAERGWRRLPGAAGGALAFLTVLPVPARWVGRADGWTVAAFPLLGLGLGLALGAADALAGALLAPPVRAALVLALWVALSGALHLDGWVDFCDALAPGLSMERARAALQDPRVGALGLAGGVLLLLLKFALLVSLPWPRWPALAGGLSLARWGAALALHARPYGGQLGREMKARLAARHLATASLLALPAIPLLGGAAGLAGVAAVAALALTLTAVAQRRLGAVRGDLYGAVIELGEAAVLLLALVLPRGP